MADLHKKSNLLGVKATPETHRRIHAHCDRLGVSLGARVLELLRLDILTHHHFDLQIEVGPTRKPKGMKAAA